MEIQVLRSRKIQRDGHDRCFQLDGQEFVALNGGHTQDEIDEYWKKLSDGGQEVQCGWLKEKAERVMQAMLQMKKIDIKRLKQAYEQE
jgi:predicted 3-demethylubiquinone-9 3-methyltransferase (glyoxalase superfamily)